MIPNELKHEFIKQSVSERHYTTLQMYICKNCARGTAHPELYDRFPEVCMAKDRRKINRRTLVTVDSIGG